MNRLEHDIERYLSGKMTLAERHALEKRALDDPFLADALEGAESINPQVFLADVAEIRARMANEKKRRWLVPLRIAASVVGIVLVVAIVMWMGKPEATPTEQAKVGETGGTPDSLRTQPESKPEESAVANADPTPEGSTKEKNLITLGPKAAERGDKALAGAGGTGTSSGLLRSDTVFENTLLAASAHRDTVVMDVAFDLEEETKITEAAPPVQPQVLMQEQERKRNALPGTNLFVTGLVRDAQGLPLPGVNINVKGQSYGTVSNADGKYSILISAPQATLHYSFIGFVSQEVAVTKENTYTDVQLLEDVTALSEVVITTGYGEKRTDGEPIVRLAEPVGGRKAYDQYLEEKKVYPTQALENNIEGKVVIQFSVSTTGAIGDFQVLRKLGYGCDEEVIRLVKEGPAWRPSYIDNEAVESVVQVKTRFSMGKKRKKG